MSPIVAVAPLAGQEQASGMSVVVFTQTASLSLHPPGCSTRFRLCHGRSAADGWRQQNPSSSALPPKGEQCTHSLQSEVWASLVHAAASLMAVAQADLSCRRGQAAAAELCSGLQHEMLSQAVSGSSCLLSHLLSAAAGTLFRRCSAELSTCAQGCIDPHCGAGKPHHCNHPAHAAGRQRGGAKVSGVGRLMPAGAS